MQRNMAQQTWKLLAATWILLLTAAPPLSAGLIDNTVACGVAGNLVTVVRPPNALRCVPGPTKVNPSESEFILEWFQNPRWRVNLNAESILVVYDREFQLNQGTFTTGASPTFMNLTGLDLGGIRSIVGFSYSQSGISGNILGASFTPDSVSIQIGGAAGEDNVWNPGDFVFLRLAVEPTSVPTPATLTLFSVGRAGLGYSRRKKT